jgi:beta-lactamase regulating signal transducer with metallopeptidase domain
MTFELAAKSLAIVLLAAGICVLLRRRSAAVRHFVWLCAFVGLAILPFAEAGLPAWHLLPSKHVALAPPVAAPNPVVTDAAPVYFDPLPTPVVEAAPAIEAAAIAGSVWRWVGVGFVLYGVLGLALAWRLSSKSSAFPDRVRFDRVKELSAVRRKVRGLLASGVRVNSAMTWGLIRPTVLMPSESTAWPDEVSDSVLMHEFAHVRRLDWAIQIGALLVCAFYWFNPAVWLAFSLLKFEAETAADEFVVSRGRPASMYASDLLTVARLACRGRRLASSGVSFMNYSRIDRRVSKILSGGSTRLGLTRIEALAGVMAALVLSAALAVASPTPGAAVLAAVAPPASKVAKTTRTRAAPRKTRHSAKRYRLHRLPGQGRLRVELRAQRAELFAEKAKLEAERLQLESERLAIEAEMKAQRVQLKSVDKAVMDAAEAHLEQAQKKMAEAQSSIGAQAAKAAAEFQGQKRVREDLIRKSTAEAAQQKVKVEIQREDQKRESWDEQKQRSELIPGKADELARVLLRRAKDQLAAADEQYRKGVVPKSDVLERQNNLAQLEAAARAADLVQLQMQRGQIGRSAHAEADLKRAQAGLGEFNQDAKDVSVLTRQDRAAALGALAKASADMSSRRDALRSSQAELLAKRLQMVREELEMASRKYAQGIVPKSRVQELAARVAELRTRMAQLNAKSRSADMKGGQ